MVTYRWSFILLKVMQSSNWCVKYIHVLGLAYEWENKTVLAVICHCHVFGH